MTGSGDDAGDGTNNGDSTADSGAGASSDAVRVLYVDGDETVCERVRSHVATAYDEATVVPTGDPEAARAILDSDAVDVLVLEPLTPALDAEKLVAAAAVPVVYYTDADPGDLSASAVDAADTVVEKWTAAEGLDFLFEKVLAAARGDGRASTRLSRAFDPVRRAGGRSCQFLVYEDGTTVWQSESLADFFERRGVEATVPESADFYRAVGGVLARDPGAVRRLRTDGAAEPTEFGLPTATGEARFRYVEHEFPETFGPVRLVVVEDVTARTRAESRVELLELLDETVQDGVSVVDADGYVEYHNEAFASLLGYDDMVGEHTASFMAPGELERGQRAVRDLFEDPARTSDVLDMGFVTADGDRRTLAVHFAVRESEGGYAGVVNVARDVTERRERERRLEAYRQLVDNAGDPMYVADADGRIRLCNEAMETLFYAGESSLGGAALADLFPSDGAERVADAIARARETGERTTCEVRLPDVVEYERRFELTVAALDVAGVGIGVGGCDGEGAGVGDGEGDAAGEGGRGDPGAGSVGVLHEVTERERRESELDVLKQVLARVLRHDVRTGLTVIRGQAEVLAEQVAGENAEIAETILDRSEQLVETTEKVRAIEQVIDGDDEWVTLDLRTVVNRAVANVAAAFPDAEYDATITERLPVRVHRAFPYAVENLVENAVEHSSTNPDSQARRDRPRVTVSATPDEGTVALHVADDGPGIADEELEVLDEREERPLKHGSGVGLWLVDWVVDRSGGSVEFDTGEEGTTVTVRVARGDPADVGREEFPR